MNIKINKDAILKHRFWIMLGVTFLLTLIGIVYLEMAVDAETERKKLVTGLDKGTKGKQNPATIEEVAKNVAQLTKKAKEVWAAAYRVQASEFKWAPEIEKQFKFFDGKFVVDIKVSHLTDAKTWPKDTRTVMHGIFDMKDDEGFTLKPREGPPVYFKRTKSVEKFLVVEENRQSVFSLLDKESRGKMLTVVYQTGRYFNDVLTLAEERVFRASYKDQIHEILQSVDPLSVDADGKMSGVVVLRDWPFRPAPEFPDKDAKFFRYVAEDFNDKKEIYREAWIAQENLWLQKEIYRMIRVANNEISDFKKIGAAKGKDGKALDVPHGFQNPNFDVELNLDAKGNLSFKIKNRLERRQSIDLNFRVLLNDKAGFAPETIRVSGLPLQPKGADKDFFVQNFPAEKSERNGVFSLQQVLSWQTAAVKRIDHISIGSNADLDGSHSHRTYVEGLKPFDEKDAKGASVAAPKFDQPPIGQPPIGGGRPAMLGFPGQLPAGGAGGNTGLLENNLWSHRYVEVTPQSRRIPIAVVLIVDQDHVDRVLTSFNNSKLRFLPTQVLLNQYAGSLQPPALAQKDPGIQGGFPFQGPFPPFRGDEGPKGPNDPAAGGSDLDTNMELVIYGIMTLYQRYPPAPRATTIATEDQETQEVSDK